MLQRACKNGITFNAPRSDWSGFGTRAFIHPWKTMTLKLDTYTIYARIFPAILSSVPLIVLWFFVTREAEWNNLLEVHHQLRFSAQSLSRRVSSIFMLSSSGLRQNILNVVNFCSARGFPLPTLCFMQTGVFCRLIKTSFASVFAGF